MSLADWFFKRPPKATPLPLNPLSTLFCAYLEAMRCRSLEVESLADAIALALVDARALRFKRVCVAYLLPGSAWREGTLHAIEQRGVTVTKRDVRHGVFVYASLEKESSDASHRNP